MSKSSNIGVNNINKKIKTFSIGGWGNLSKKSNKAYIGVNNIAKEGYSAEEEEPAYPKLAFATSVVDGYVKLYTSLDNGATITYKNQIPMSSSIGATSYFYYSKTLNRWRLGNYWSPDHTLKGTWTSASLSYQNCDDLYVYVSSRTFYAGKLTTNDSGGITQTLLGQIYNSTLPKSAAMRIRFCTDGYGTYAAMCGYENSSSNFEIYISIFTVTDNNINILFNTHQTIIASSPNPRLYALGQNKFCVEATTSCLRYSVKKSGSSWSYTQVESSGFGSDCYGPTCFTASYCWYTGGYYLYRTNKNYGTATNLGSSQSGNTYKVSDKDYIYEMKSNGSVYRTANGTTWTLASTVQNGIIMAYSSHITCATALGTVTNSGSYSYF